MVENHGPDTATGVVLTDPLPDDCTFVSASSTQGSSVFADTDLTCDIGDLESGETVHVTVTVSPVRVGVLTSTATVTSNAIDPDGDNDTASAETLLRSDLVARPARGTVGSQFEIEGLRFGYRKGRARLTVDGGTQKLKVLAWYEDLAGNGTIRARIRRGMPAGTYSLVVTPRSDPELRELTEADAFVIEAPEITESPKSLDAGDSMTLRGAFFGEKKPKVQVEYRKGQMTKRISCRATSWTDNRIRCRLSRRTPPGDWTLVLRNQVGEDRVPFTVN